MGQGTLLGGMGRGRLIAPVALTVLLLLLAAIIGVLGGATAAFGVEYNQCESAVGPDPAITETPTVTLSDPTGEPEFTTTIPPTATSEVEVTIAPDNTTASQWDRDCASAMRYAQPQKSPLRTPYRGFAAECARQAALAQLNGYTKGNSRVVDQAVMTAAVIRTASLGALSGVCRSATTAETDPRQSGVGESPVAQDDSATARCQDPAARAVIVLPETLDVQGFCGQRVDPSAVSPGDLVFWDHAHRGHVPGHVGVWIGPNLIVSSDPVSGQVRESEMPTGRDVLIKRVLGGLP
ncbi:NlpC/P60 family protein [Nocardia sp. NPDC046763]|uniref:NlpC/P60 family protein n=1 Tax=Nocardia sp. NPDC046763 TaxID=3155256 RepID=UPI0033ECBAFA